MQIEILEEAVSELDGYGLVPAKQSLRVTFQQFDLLVCDRIDKTHVCLIDQNGTRTKRESRHDTSHGFSVQELVEPLHLGCL